MWCPSPCWLATERWKTCCWCWCGNCCCVRWMPRSNNGCCGKTTLLGWFEKFGTKLVWVWCWTWSSFGARMLFGWRNLPCKACWFGTWFMKNGFCCIGDWTNVVSVGNCVWTDGSIKMLCDIFWPNSFPLGLNSWFCVANRCWCCWMSLNIWLCCTGVKKSRRFPPVPRSGCCCGCCKEEKTIV